MKNYLIYLFILISFLSTSSLFSQGFLIGANGEQLNRIGSVVVFPSGIMAIGTMDGVIFRSTDNGATWLPATSGPGSVEGAYTTMVTSSNYNQTMAANYGHGVLYSPTQGGAWYYQNKGLEEFGSRNVNDIAVGTAESFIANDKGVYQYSDPGTGYQWNKFLTPPVGEIFTTLSYDEGYGILYAGTDGGVVYYYEFATPSSGIAYTFPYPITEISNMIFMGTPVTLVACEPDPGGADNVFMLVNSGGMFMPQPFGVLPTVRQFAMSLFTYSGTTMPIIFAATDEGVYMMDISGSAWTKISGPGTGLEIDDILCAAADPLVAASSAMYVGTNGDGLYKGTLSIDPIGMTLVVNWIRLVSGAPVSSAAVTSLCYYSSTLYAGTAGDGIFKYNGINWMPFSGGLLTGNVTSLANGPIYLYAGTDQGLYRRDPVDPNASWELTNYDGGNIQCMFIPQATGEIYVGTLFGLFYSSDNGDNWQKIQIDAFIWDISVYAVVASGSEIMIGTYGFGVYRSTDGGVTWAPFNSGMSSVLINTLSTDPIPLDLSGAWAGTVGAGLWNRNGSSWEFNNFEYQVVSSVGVFYHNISGITTIVAGITGGGFYYSDNYGTDWNEFDLIGKKSSTDILCFAQNPETGDIYLGTNGQGVYCYTTNITDVEEEAEIPQTYTLEQNYPNPFNPTTTIQFEVPVKGYYTVDIYNMIGEKVQQVVDNQFEPGTYEVIFDAGNLPSGIYIYSLQGANVIMSQKMILLK